MQNPVRLLVRSIPEGYAKSIIKNASGFVVNLLPKKVISVNIKGTRLRMYEDRVFDTKLLAKEISGYNSYYNLKKGDIVIDAGAYSGLFTIYAAKKVGSTGKVIAYEPDPYNWVILNKNIELNNLKNVEVVKKGLFDKVDSLPFDVQSVGSNIVSIDHAFHNRKTINHINVAPLDEEIKRLGLKKVNFIKMDIEGAEIEAMKGATQTLKHKSINLAIASYHVVNKKKTCIFLEKFFKKLGMNVVTENNGQLTTYASYTKLKKLS